MNTKKNIAIIAVTIFSMSREKYIQKSKEIQWIGGPTIILKLGSFKILIDPMLGPKSKVSFRIKKHPTTGELNAAIERFYDPAEFDHQNIDLMIISHPHPDHIDEKAIQTLDKNIKTITTTTSVETFLNWGFRNTDGLEWGDTVTFQKENESLKITAVTAMHAKEGSLNTELGKVNGYIIEYIDYLKVYRIYCTGDTVFFEDIREFKKYGPIDLLIPNMGAAGNGLRGLNAIQCLKIIETLNPKKVIPVHHTTFSHYTESISVLQNEISKTKYKNRLKIIALGAIVEL